MKTRKVAVAALVFSILLTMFSGISTTAKASYNLEQVAYYDRVKQALNLTAQQESMLQEHGFVVAELPITKNLPTEDELDILYDSPWARFEDFYYIQVYNPDLPVFVTTDSMLHLFHVVFDCSLRMIEEETFYPLIRDVTQYAYNRSMNDYSLTPHDGSTRYWAIRNATVYFAVAVSLINGVNATVPNELKEDLSFYLDKIYAKEFVYAGSWKTPSDLVDLQYDFTQFTVRGHYLGVPRLEQYFRTLMWYGNMPIFVPRNDENYSWGVSHIDDPSMVYMRDIFKNSTSCYNEWMMVYNVTNVLVGESDSINPLFLETALHNAFGDKTQYLDSIATANGLTMLRAELAKPEYEQRILGQALLKYFDVPLSRYPIVFQFMGQRYVPDSYMFQMLCYDKTGRSSVNGQRRLMPKGLDVFAVLGSQRAYELLTPEFVYENYTKNLATLKDEFSNLTEEEWTQSSYTAWINSLQSLTNVQYDSSYPDFMRGIAWKDEKLNTALGGWAQLRHDTLLYAKQTYIPGLICSYPEAFVEPNPTFYSRMQQLCQRTIDAINILPTGSVDQAINSSLATLKDATQKFQLISTRELARQQLTAEETDFVKKIVWATEGCGPQPTGWYYNTITNIATRANYTALLNVPVIADVATFPPGDIYDPPQIFHVGVGYVDALVVLYPMNNGTLVAAVGPVFSYYEFPLIGTKRLNDDEWKAMLALNNHTAYLPSEIKDVYALAAPIVPENTAAIFLVVTVVTTATALTMMIGTRKFNRKPS
jgi:Protein of unknown function (DUF3160)